MFDASATVKMAHVTKRLNDLELEILDVLRMDPETAGLLTEMVAPEGEQVSAHTVRSCLDSLGSQGLVRASQGWYADPSGGECVEACWWEITDEGRAVVAGK